MKDKNCVNPKMAAYCQAVRNLENKFHGLELHRVLHDYNKAADVLTKTASSRSPVPHVVFASDQHVPSIRAEGEKPPEEGEPEVMAIDQLPELNLEDPDRRFPTLEWLVEGKLPPTKRRLDESPAGQRRSSSSRASSTSGEQLAYSCGASLETRTTNCYKRYTLTPATITQAQGHLSGRPSGKVSTGPRQWRTPRTSYNGARGVSSTLEKLTFRRRHYRPSPSRGLLLSGTSTWWGRSDKRPGASLTSS
jgi:hypothetical protein